MNKKIAILVALLFILPSFVYCSLEDTVEGFKSTPYYGMTPAPPPQSRETRQEKTQMMGSEFTIILYASELSFPEIAKFYRERLGREGWEDISTNEKVKGLAQSGFFSKALIFRKDEEMINIQNLPSANPRETAFSLSRGSIQVLKTGEPQVSEVKFRDLPVYPNAAVEPLSSMRSATKEQLGYTTVDSAEKVMQFYREKLPISGWTIQSELPLSDYSGDQGLPADMQEKLKGSSMKMSALNITKQGKSCYVGVTEMSPKDDSGVSTIISISCNK